MRLCVSENPSEPFGASTGIVLVRIRERPIRFHAVVDLAFVIKYEHIGRNAGSAQQRFSLHFSGHNLNVGTIGPSRFP